MTPVKIYAIFHMNLAFSSIEKESHLEVVQRCYWPLLQLIESGIPLGLEMTAYTLEAIQSVDPDWIKCFKTLLNENRCELIASGDSQIIGPLVPADVNRHNLRLGQVSYNRILGYKPTIAYLNEQAVSAGLLDIYLEVGFDAVVVEWDNPYSHNPNWHTDLLKRPQSLVTALGNEIKVIWNYAIAFQKFQRYVHGELLLEDYLQYLNKVIQPGCLAFPLYGSDAEVFDYRPGRYNTEAVQTDKEWQRIDLLFKTLNSDARFLWSPPCDVMTLWRPSPALTLTNAEHPVSVKKQAKYNINRWALSGRNDLQLNSECFADFQKLNKATATDHQWRQLCRRWASDLRTHLTQKRFEALAVQKPIFKLSTLISQNTQQTNIIPDNVQIEFDEARRKLSIQTPVIHLILNANRGLCIEKLSFMSQEFTPILGTLSHGYFDHISYGVDFFSNHLLMERFRHRDRVTDLNKVEYQILNNADDLLILSHQSLRSGGLSKWYRLSGENLTCGFTFDNHTRPEASLRLGYVTLLDCSQRNWYLTHLGSDTLETFQAKNDFNHGNPVSSIVSATSALGATAGEVRFGSGPSGVKLKWDPAHCAALPMISSQKINDNYLNRLWFSLIEADETLKEDGYLPSFEYSISPCSLQCETRK